MKNYESHKEEELKILRYYQHFAKDFPKGKIKATESPDFILMQGPKRSIGIEFTRLILPHKTILTTNDKQKVRFTLQCHKKFLLHANLPVSAHFHFRENSVLTEEQLDYHAYQTSRFIINSVKKENLKKNIRMNLSGSGLPPYINSVDLIYFRDSRSSEWSICMEKISQGTFMESFENLIQKKEEKLKLYQKRFLENYWLIIYSDCLRNSLNTNLLNLLERVSLYSGFDRIILIELFRRKEYIIKERA